MCSGNCCEADVPPTQRHPDEPVAVKTQPGPIHYFYTRNQLGHPVTLIAWNINQLGHIIYATATHNPNTVVEMQHLKHGIYRRVCHRDRFSRKRARQMVDDRLTKIQIRSIFNAVVGAGNERIQILDDILRRDYERTRMYCAASWTRQRLGVENEARP